MGKEGGLAISGAGVMLTWEGVACAICVGFTCIQLWLRGQLR